MSNGIATTLLPAELTAESLFGAVFEPDVWRNPYPLYDELRGRSGLERIGDHRWVASRHRAVQDILRDPTFSSDEHKSTEAAGEVHEDGNPTVASFMLFQDPPDHTRLRSLVVRAFTRGSVAEIEPSVKAIVDELVPRRYSGELDLVSNVATPMAVRVICRLLGVPESDRHHFHAWGEALARSLDPAALRSPEQDAAGNAAADAFTEYFDRLIAMRRADPADDLLSALIGVEEDGDRLSFTELIGVCMLVLVAGFETTINLVGNGLVALDADRAALERLGANRALLPAAVDELLRFDSPVQMNIRVATVDRAVNGSVIRAGDTVFNLLGAANRDPQAFDRPNVLDLGRKPNPHLSFGGGIHHCLGAALAKTEARLLFERIACDHEVALAAAPTRRATFTLRGYETVPVVLTPR